MVMVSKLAQDRATRSPMAAVTVFEIEADLRASNKDRVHGILKVSGDGLQFQPDPWSHDVRIHGAEAYSVAVPQKNVLESSECEESAVRSEENTSELHSHL